MAYVLVPPLPSGARKSDYVPLEQLPPRRERSDAVKGKVRVGDNSGSTALAAALQDAFQNNATSSVRTETQTARGRRKKRGKQKAVDPVEPIEVVDDEDGDEEAEAQKRGSATLAHALSVAFAHNSADPNVAAAGASGSTRHIRRSMYAGEVSVEIVIPPPAKRPRGRPRLTTKPDNDHNIRTPSTPASHRRNEKRQPQSPSGPQKKRRRVTRSGDNANVHGSEDDGDIEILDDATQDLRHSPRHKPRSNAVPPGPKPRRISQHRRASMASRVPAPVPTSDPLPLPSPSPTPTLPPQSPPDTPSPDNNALSGHPLTILPVPSPTGIVIAPRALIHLPASPGSPDPQSGAKEWVDGNSAQPRQNGSLQDFHSEEAAIGAHGLLESPAAAATTMDSSVCAIPTTTATTATNVDMHHHPPDIGLDVVAPMEIGDVEQQERQDAVRTTVVPSHALRISSSTHPDGPMLGFALSEHDGGPGPASLSADADTEASSDGFGLGLGVNTGPDMDFMPTASLNSYLSDGAGWIGWGAAGPSNGIVTGDEYVGDGTIDPSVLGGCGGFGASPGAVSPRKLFRSDTVASESSLRGFAFARAIDVRNGGGEQDVTDGDFVPSAGKGKVTRARTVVGAGRIGAGDVRIRTKSWRKALADENEGSEDTDDAADDDSVEQRLDVGVARRSTSSNLSPSETSASAPASTAASLRLQVLKGEATSFCHHCRCKTRRPKMRCTFIRESTGVQCRKLYCDLCIEKRYDSTFLP